MNIRLLASCLLIFVISYTLSAQNKKQLTPEDYKSWNRIKNVKIAPNGENIIYTLSGERTNKELHIYNTRTKGTYTFPRVEQPTIDYNGNIVMWKSVADVDTIREMKRRKIEDEEMPGENL